MDEKHKQATHCAYCDKELKRDNYIPKSEEWRYNYCSSIHAIRCEAEKRGQVLWDDVIEDPFIQNGNYCVDVPWDYIADTLARYTETYRLNLNPDFQRAHVWTEQQQIAFVEYILRGGYAGKTIYFNYPHWQGSKQKLDDEMVIVDGKQRLQAVTRFLTNEIPVFGKYYYRDFYLKAFNYGFKIYINNLATKKEVLKWYLDLNTGGTPHTNEEIEKVKKMLEAENVQT